MAFIRKYTRICLVVLIISFTLVTFLMERRTHTSGTRNYPDKKEQSKLHPGPCDPRRSRNCRAVMGGSEFSVSRIEGLRNRRNRTVFHVRPPEGLQEVHMEFDDTALDESDDEKAPLEPKQAELRAQSHVGGKSPGPKKTARQKTMITNMKNTRHIWRGQNTKSILQACGEQDYKREGSLPSATVVIAFDDNVTMGTVLHTVHSVYQRSDLDLLDEIILVDDYSKTGDLSELLPIYIHGTFGSKVRIIRSEYPLGLTRARLKGIRGSRSKVIVVLDAAMEVQPGWLEPMLHEINKNPKTLASSFLDHMKKSDGEWEYIHGQSSGKTYFDFSFRTGWQKISMVEASHKPFRSPVTAGLVFAMEKQFFEQVGAFDTEMESWAGVNIDISVRVWLFGGQVLNVPCSRVGHVGNNTLEYDRSPSALKNYQRVAEVWLDDYKRYFYLIYPHMRLSQVGDISDRMLLKKQIRPRFFWYRRTIFPELGIPELDSFAWGGVHSLGTSRCLQGMDDSAARLVKCDDIPDSQKVFWSVGAELRMTMNILTTTYFDHEGYTALSQMEIMSNYESNITTKWAHWKDGPIIDVGSGRCLTASGKENNYIVKLQQCLPGDPMQIWNFNSYSPTYNSMMDNKLIRYTLIYKNITKYKTSMGNNLVSRKATESTRTDFLQGSQVSVKISLNKTSQGDVVSSDVNQPIISANETLTHHK